MKKLARCVVPLVMAAAAMTAFGQGATPAAAQPAGEPVTWGRLSIASLDAVTKLLTDLEIPGGENLRPMIESVPFLGQGSVAGDKPLGILLIADENQPLQSEKNLIAAMPLNEGKATPAELTKAGAKAIEGKPDTLSLDGTLFRRSAGYLFARSGESAAGLGTLADTLFANDYRTAGNLLVATADLAKLRTGSPNVYKQMAALGAFLPIPAGDPGPGNPVQAALDAIDRLTFTFNRDEKNLHLQLWKVPFAAKAVKQLPRPAFPGGVIAQMHVVYPDAETAAWLDQQIDTMQDASLPGAPEQRAQMKALLKRLSRFNSRAEGVSVGVAVKDNMPVVYIVDQLREDVDLAAEMKAISEDLKVLAKDDIVGNEMSTYDAGGKTVQRLALAGKEASQRAYIDGMMQGRTLFVTIGTKDERMVGGLAAAGMAGTSNVLCAGVLDLTAALNAASTGAGGPLADLPPDALAKLKTAFAGQGVTWTVQGAEGGGNYMYVDVAFPFNAVREVSRVTQQMSGAPATPGGAVMP